jgi:hypothetical protein
VENRVPGLLTFLQYIHIYIDVKLIIPGQSEDGPLADICEKGSDASGYIKW